MGQIYHSVNIDRPPCQFMPNNLVFNSVRLIWRSFDLPLCNEQDYNMFEKHSYEATNEMNSKSRQTPEETSLPEQNA